MAAKLSKPIKKTSFRQVKHFSEVVKRQTVKDIEQGKCSVLEASRELSVSIQSIYGWVYKYSGYLQKNKTLVVQDISESYKTKVLESKLREAEAALGRKQMELDILNKMIELAGEELKIDIKKFLKPCIEWYRANQGVTHLLKLTDLYATAGVNKQSMCKYRKAKQAHDKAAERVVAAMEKMRKGHKKMSSRKVYASQKEAFKIEVGRDKFEAIAFSNGYRVKHKRQVQKTTWGQRVEVYPDLVSGITINNIDQVYQSDIFYIKVANTDYYGVTIIDVYSKRLVALRLSRTLQARENTAALKEVLKSKTKAALEGCIFHSDRGSQYISGTQKELLQSLGMKISMCRMPQQNAYVERVQGSLKYEYFFESLLTEKNITRMASKIMKLYNDERPHQSLNNKTPKQFESMIEQLERTERPKMKIFNWVTE